jgi:N-acetylglucosamine-6-phosphate deacetylase
MARTAFHNGRVLIGSRIDEDVTVLVENARIVSIDELGRAASVADHVVDLNGRLLLPGFIDVQVNGGGGVLFNAEPTASGIRVIATTHRRCGTTGLLPTLITDELDVVRQAMAAVDEAIETGVSGVLGIHLEGPYLNAERKGAHDGSKLRRLEASGVPLLTSLRRGRTLVTLAPEVTAPGAIEALVAAGVIVSAGHTNADADVMSGAFRRGVTGITHLFNAMSQLGSRAPGVVGATLNNQDAYAGIIVDGRHVDPSVLRLALRCRPLDRFLLVTDAMPCVGSSSDVFVLQGRTIRVRDGVCVDDAGTLSGAAIDMATAVRNAVTMLGLPIADAVRMATEAPARFLGLDGEVGRIHPGCRANLLVTNDRLEIEAVWIDGENQQ